MREEQINATLWSWNLLLFSDLILFVTYRYTLRRQAQELRTGAPRRRSSRMFSVLNLFMNLHCATQIVCLSFNVHELVESLPSVCETYMTSIDCVWLLDERSLISIALGVWAGLVLLVEINALLNLQHRLTTTVSPVPTADHPRPPPTFRPKTFVYTQLAFHTAKLFFLPLLEPALFADSLEHTHQAMLWGTVALLGVFLLITGCGLWIFGLANVAMIKYNPQWYTHFCCYSCWSRCRARRTCCIFSSCSCPCPSFSFHSPSSSPSSPPNRSCTACEWLRRARAKTRAARPMVINGVPLEETNTTTDNTTNATNGNVPLQDLRPSQNSNTTAGYFGGVEGGGARDLEAGM